MLRSVIGGGGGFKWYLYATLIKFHSSFLFESAISSSLFDCDMFTFVVLKISLKKTNLFQFFSKPRYVTVERSLSQLSLCWIWHLTSSWAQFLSNKLEFFVSCNIKITKTSCSVFWYVLFYKNLIVLHHVDNHFLFYFDICIKFTLSAIISTMNKW